jgi:hypothetical protein
MSCIVIAFALGGGCGGDDDAPDPIVPPTDPCSPHLPVNWVPRWKPPIAPRPDACTTAQIDREYASCESVSSTSATCAAFRNDANNAACLACLFSDEGDASYGPVLRSAGVWRSNTSGCIALLDGNASANGCGARVQASSTCYDAACDGCTPIDAYVKCRQKAAETSCRQYYLDAVCVLRPEYASCTEYATNQEYFVSAARLFCASGTSVNVPRSGEGVP